MKIGIFGGTFNPIHNGHIKAAQEIYKKLKLNKVLFIPCYQPPHKSVENQTAPNIRMSLLKQALEPYPYFEISDIEFKRKGISYTIDTLKVLRKQYKKDEFFLIMGLDQLIQFHTWKNYKDIFNYARLIVYERGEKELTEKYKQKYLLDYLKKIIFVKIKTPKISSTDIRDRIKKGQSILKFVPAKIVQKVRDNY